MIQLICTGGRDYRNISVIEEALESYQDHIRHVHVGDAPGADAIVFDWCKRNVVPVVVHQAHWMRDGKAAGPIRNRAMIQRAIEWAGECDGVAMLAFPGGRGTEDAKRQYRKMTGHEPEEVDTDE